MLTVTEARTVDGSWCVRYSYNHPGVLTAYKSPADAFMDYLRRITGRKNTNKLAEDLGISIQALYATRAGKRIFDHAWILWAHEYTGAPLESLRIVSGTKPRKATVS